MDSEEEEITWLESGHEWLGRRVRRLFPGSGFADGTISAVRVLRHGSCSRPDERLTDSCPIAASGKRVTPISSFPTLYDTNISSPTTVAPGY